MFCIGYALLSVRLELTSVTTLPPNGGLHPLAQRSGASRVKAVVGRVHWLTYLGFVWMLSVLCRSPIANYSIYKSLDFTRVAKCPLWDDIRFIDIIENVYVLLGFCNIENSYP